MIMGLIAGITTKAAIEMFMAGATASITLLCAGTKVRKRK